MKLAYAFRRGTFYPFVAGAAWDLPDGDTRTRYLRQVKDIGFDGIDAGNGEALELAKGLADAGVPCVAMRAGGGLCQPNVAEENRARLEKAVDVAGRIGVGVVNTALATQPMNRMLDSGPNGAPTSHGSSQMATEDDFARTAAVLRRAGEVAGASGVEITIEVHQHSIADNSWSTLNLLDMVDSPHVFANPDLGNILWTYDVPEESSEDAILALAPRSKYWHCKNLHRVHIAENEHSNFIRVPLPDGDIDYRFAINAMQDAGYDGYLAIEGANLGDQLHADRRSVEYVRGILSEPR